MRVSDVPDATEEPLISIALCTYNGAKHLREQMDSLFAQTYGHFEIVVVDDGSTDATLAILEEYACRSPRVRLSVNSGKLGFKRNFELALSSCHGALIAPCDQDDVWLPRKLSSLMTALGSATMAYCDSELIDAAGSPLGVRLSDFWHMQDLTDPVSFAPTNCVSGHAMIFRRELLERALPVPEGFFHDWWLAAAAAATGGIVYLPQALVRYRQHPHSVTDVLGARGRHRVPGHGTAALREFGLRIAALAQLPGEQQPLLQEWNRLWRAREEQWLSLKLGLFMARHRKRLYRLNRYSDRQALNRAAHHFFGLRLKRMMHPHKYRKDMPLLDVP